jgi:FkbM family methyltransferase
MDPNIFRYFNAQFDAVALVESSLKAGIKPLPGSFVNFLGTMIRPEYLPSILTGKGGTVEPVPIPANWHADVAEWAAVLRSVQLAPGPSFAMIELGCGWGCWMANSGVAARSRGLSSRLFGVEADEGHVSFAQHCLRLNGFSAEQFEVMRGVAAARGGKVLFPLQAGSGVDWGLQPVFDASEQQIEEALSHRTHVAVDMVDLNEILKRQSRFDLVHLDIQGGEAVLLSETIEDLSRNVAYVVIGTHSRPIEGRIFDLMLAHGWILEIERPAILRLEENSLPVTIVDGVQGWRNPALLPL